MTGEIVTPRQHLEILGRLIGKEVLYHQISSAEMYKKLMELGTYSHLIVLQLPDDEYIGAKYKFSPCIGILPGKKPETVEEYLTLNKEQIK